MKKITTRIFMTAAILACGFSVSAQQRDAEGRIIENSIPELSFIETPQVLVSTDSSDGCVFVVNKEVVDTNCIVDDEPQIVTYTWDCSLGITPIQSLTIYTVTVVDIHCCCCCWCGHNLNIDPQMPVIYKAEQIQETKETVVSAKTILPEKHFQPDSDITKSSIKIPNCPPRKKDPVDKELLVAVVNNNEEDE